MLDPIGVVSALRAAVDGVGVGAVTERAEMEWVDGQILMEVFKICTITILKSLETSDQDYQARGKAFFLERIERVHLLLGQLGVIGTMPVQGYLD